MCSNREATTPPKYSLEPERYVPPAWNWHPPNQNFLWYPKMTILVDREYAPINWRSGFRYPNMVRIRTIADGSCFFHAIANSFFIPYRKQMLNGQSVSKQRLIQTLRRDLATKLAKPVDPMDPNSPIHYDILGRGQLKEFAKAMPEYSLENMQRELNSASSVDNAYNEFISNQLGKDIYLLNSETEDVCITGDDDDILYKNRASIVILCLPGHYELVGIIDENGAAQTHFTPNHNFIQAIRARMQELRAQSRNK